jgi:hypothetical protein
VIGDQMTLSPTIINSIHFTWARLAVHRSDPANMPSPTQEGINIYDGSPNFSYITVSNYFTIGGGSNAPAKFIRNQYQWSDDTDWIKGKHHFSFGAENILGQMYQSNVYDSNGLFNIQCYGDKGFPGRLPDGEVSIQLHGHRPAGEQLLREVHRRVL